MSNVQSHFQTGEMVPVIVKHEKGVENGACVRKLNEFLGVRNLDK